MSDLERRTVLRAAALTAMGLGAAVAVPGTASADTDDEGAKGRVPRGTISIQLYSLRDMLTADLEVTLAALARIGYRKVEMAGTYGRTAAQFRAILDRHGLHATSSHVGVNANWQASLDDALTLGNRFIVHPYANYATAGEWRRFADELESAGAAARAAGLRFGYHNHAHEFAKLPTGERPYDIITAADPKLVHLEVDLYWAVTGGADPVALFSEHESRIKQFHVKDRAADGSFADVGTGTIDFRRIFANADETGVLEYIVERDSQPHPVETARIGYEYLRKVRFGR